MSETETKPKRPLKILKMEDSIPVSDIVLCEDVPMGDMRPVVDLSTLKLHALGFKDNHYYFTSTSNRQIISIRGFQKNELLQLMPLEWFEALYSDDNRKVKWDYVTSLLMDQCRRRGLFYPNKIRGAGIWPDQGRVVINMGDHLLVDGVRCEFDEIESDHFYTMGRKIKPLSQDPLTAEECKVVTEAAKTFKWKKTEYGYLLAGAMVTLRVCGGLPIRPHVWLSGERGSGKTTLFNRFINPLIAEPRQFLAGNSTEAGIRQAMAADAVPLIIDEFETNGQRSAETIRSVLDLFRMAWSETDAVVLKGSSGGVAQQYQVRFAGVVTCIRPYKLSDADQTRFASIELAPHDNDLEHWKKLDGHLSEITPEFSERLFSRIVKLFPVLLQNFKVMKKALAKAHPGQRFGDQYGMILAGYAILLYDDVIDHVQAEELIKEAQLTDAIDTSDHLDQDDALHHLLTTKISYDDGTGKREALIGELVFDAHKEVKEEKFATPKAKALLRLGIKVHGDTLFVATGIQAELAKVFSQTQWVNWGASLSRLKGAARVQQRINGRNVRCIGIPWTHLDSEYQEPVQQS